MWKLVNRVLALVVMAGGAGVMLTSSLTHAGVSIAGMLAFIVGLAWLIFATRRTARDGA